MDLETVEEGLWLIAQAMAEEERQKPVPIPRGVRAEPDSQFPPIGGRGRPRRGSEEEARPGGYERALSAGLRLERWRTTPESRNPQDGAQAGPSGTKGSQQQPEPPAREKKMGNSETKQRPEGEVPIQDPRGARPRAQPTRGQRPEGEVPIQDPRGARPRAQPTRGQRPEDEVPIQDPRGARPRAQPAGGQRTESEGPGQDPRGANPRRTPREQRREQVGEPVRDVRMAKLKDRQEWIERGAKIGLKTPQLAHENARCYNCGKQGHLREKCENRRRRFCRTCFENHDWFGPQVGWRCRYAEEDWHLLRVQQDRAERERRRRINKRE